MKLGKRSHRSLAGLLVVAAAACGGGGGGDDNQNVGNDPVDDGTSGGGSPTPAPTPTPTPGPAPNPAPGPNPSPNPAPAPGGIASLRTANQTTPIASPLNQSFTCEPAGTPFRLTLDANGQALVEVSGEAPLAGQYSVSNNQVSITLNDGSSAMSIGALTVPGLIVGMRLSDSGGASYACVARAHTLGDRSTEDEAIRCGRRNIAGESEDTFTLFTNGAAQWENVFELPGAVDTTFQTRLGTYVFDQASGTITMAYKDLGNDDLLFFDAAINGTAVEMQQAPPSGAGSETLTSGCRFLE